jgi:hypothetical protein
MSYAVTTPESSASAATDLDGIGSVVSAANAAAVPTTGVVAAAAGQPRFAGPSFAAGVRKRYTSGFRPAPPSRSRTARE